VRAPLAAGSPWHFAVYAARRGIFVALRRCCMYITRINCIFQSPDQTLSEAIHVFLLLFGFV
jgi:hypothetical protein